MNIDESFKKPGSVPFKWEIRPGVPKPLNEPPSNHHRTSSLKPPPSSPTSFHFPSPTTQSTRFEFHPKQPVARQPDVVSSGCFQARRLGSFRKTNKLLHVNDPMYKSDLERLSEWSVSTRKSGSALYNDSPLSSASFSSSYRSSPRMVGVSDAEWAGYGLF
ncbi:hypothetical protein QVD17_10265 [Tagetes erecta]|uniref:Uncharacterized protein n=1 Tax=Tagetes erecta TaxID=13708 RepID=A0AAD8L0S1_TARER|nr:hypothetical protein QVD17_10265 [Tagetes erecta]